MRVVAGSRGYVSRRPKKTRVRVCARMHAQDNSGLAVAYPRLPRLPAELGRNHERRQPKPRCCSRRLTERKSARGNVYLRGWLGASNLVGFRGEDDDQGRATWQLFLVERQPKQVGQASARRPPEREATSARATEPASAGTRPASSYRALRRESQRLGKSASPLRWPSVTAPDPAKTSMTKSLFNHRRPAFR